MLSDTIWWKSSGGIIVCVYVCERDRMNAKWPERLERNSHYTRGLIIRSSKRSSLCLLYADVCTPSIDVLLYRTWNHDYLRLPGTSRECCSSCWPDLIFTVEAAAGKPYAMHLVESKRPLSTSY